MLGIRMRYECPECGNIITIEAPFWNKELRKKLPEPTHCGCGRTKGFSLYDFEKCQFILQNEKPAPVSQDDQPPIES